MPSRGQLERTSVEDATPQAQVVAAGPAATTKGNTQPVRLYVKGCFYSFFRGQRNTYHDTVLLKLQGVQDQKAAEFYFGKRVAYIYKVRLVCNGRHPWSPCRHHHPAVPRQTRPTRVQHYIQPPTPCRLAA